MIITLDMSQGFLPTKVTFQVDSPGCAKVGYHNIDIFEPGRVNTFRQYQQSTDLNSEILPMCVCLNPRITRMGICTDISPFYTPPKALGFTGFSIRDLYKSYVELCIAVMPDEDIYNDNVGPALAQALNNLNEDINWDGPHLWGRRNQRDFEEHGIAETEYECPFNLSFSDGTGSSAWSTALGWNPATTFNLWHLTFVVAGFPWITIYYPPYAYNVPIPLSSYTVDVLYPGYFGPPSLKPIFDQWAVDNIPAFIQLDEVA